MGTSLKRGFLRYLLNEYMTITAATNNRGTIIVNIMNSGVGDGGSGVAEINQK